MVTRTGRQKARKRSGVKLKTLEANGMEILGEKGPVVDAGPSLYLVPSMSSDSYHDVRHLAGIWSCDCPYYVSGHTVCKHICAARATLLVREEAASAMGKTCVEDPQIRCSGCGLADFHESTTYMTRRGEATVYMCDHPPCRKRFTWRPGFEKKWFSDEVITDALIDAGAGHPPARIVERMSKNGVSVDERTIRRWIDEYAELVERFASTLHYAVGGRWSIDEKHLKTHPDGSRKKRWLAAPMDEATGLIMGYEVTDSKSGYDATGLLERAIALTGRVPDVMVADKLSGYKKGFMNAIKRRNPAAVLVADAGINGRHVNNNRRERTNGELGECLDRARGFRSRIPGLVRLTILYHNFMHTLAGNGGVAPAEAAGVIVAGLDKFKTLIRNAALAAT